MQRANSAGRFRCGCPRSYTARKKPSTSFAGPPRTERSPLPCGHLPTPWGVTYEYWESAAPDGASPHPVGSHPFQGRLYVSLQTPYLRNLTACTSDTSKSQHYTYRQGQQPALASPKRTASAASEFRRTVSMRLPQKIAVLGQVRGAMWAFSVKSNTLRKGFPSAALPLFHVKHSV